MEIAIPGNQRCANCPHYRKIDEQVGVQLPTYADNVALPTFARRCCSNRSITVLAECRHGPVVQRSQKLISLSEKMSFTLQLVASD